MRTRTARVLTTTVLTVVSLCWITPAFAQLSPNMQDILRRIHTAQETELNKQSSLVEYPNRRHGISGHHIDTLRREFVTHHLPASGRSPVSAGGLSTAARFVRSPGEADLSAWWMTSLCVASCPGLRQSSQLTLK